MKVIHSALVRFMRGRYSGAVLYEAPSQEFSIQRNYVYPTITAHNHSMGAIMQNLRTAVWNALTAGYRSDFALYASRFYSENLDLPNYAIPVNNSFGQFIYMMYQIYEENPAQVDLATVTLADLIVLGIHSETVKDAIDNGLLRPISSYDDLDEPWA